jgi:ubiquinone/menaquinone biosynthesis C-methylase UbiE
MFQVVRKLARLLRVLLVVFLLWQVVLRLVRRWLKFPAPAFISVFLNSRFRRALQPPADVMGWVDIRPGMQVLELGPGPGTFTVEAARRAAPQGVVHAVDIQADMLERLQETLATAGVANVSLHLSSAYALPVPDHSIDRLFMVTVLSEIPDKPRSLAEFRRVLKPGGMLAVGEFLLDPDFPRPVTVRRWCEAAGFHFIARYGTLLHYLMTFRT